MVAADILAHVFRENKPITHYFDKNMDKHGFARNDRNLAMQLIYGVLRKRKNLDRILEILSKTPLKKIDPLVHQILVVGLFQIFYLDRIPDSAAVNEAVKCCKQARIPKRIHGFVNGILRESIRRRDKLSQQANTDSKNKPIVNYPNWLLQKWLVQFGEETCVNICQIQDQEPPLTLRTNTCRLSRNDLISHLRDNNIACDKGSLSEESIRIHYADRLVTSLPGYQDGFFQVQDEAAQLATHLLGPFIEGGYYLDGCAGLGGKTTHLLQLAKQYNLTVHGIEPDEKQCRKLVENIQRLFVDPPFYLHKQDLLHITPSSMQKFDGVLVDAPCSGTGVIRRHPDIRWNRSKSSLKIYQSKQLSLLEHASNFLKKGGILVYATCSIEPEENETVIELFLKKNPHFTLTNCGDFLPTEATDCLNGLFFSPLPSPVSDGFFSARLIRK